MGDWVADFPDSRNDGGRDGIAEIPNHLSSTSNISSRPCPSKEISKPASFDSGGSLPPRTHRNTVNASDTKKLTRKRNWKKIIANSITKIGASGGGASFFRHEKAPCLPEIESEARICEGDELSILFSTSDKEKLPRLPSWRKLIMCASMKKADEDMFSADRSLQEYIASWN
uniref:Uncharacterized protein n=1 Tax=Kalanchoe fedtschenkoi TaxID=63787 RepID=A0A7N0URG9_KALFE